MNERCRYPQESSAIIVDYISNVGVYSVTWNPPNPNEDLTFSNFTFGAGQDFGPQLIFNGGIVKFTSDSRNLPNSKIIVSGSVSFSSNALLTNEGEISWEDNATFAVKTNHTSGSFFEILTKIPGASLKASVDNRGSIVAQESSLFNIAKGVSITNYGQFNLSSRVEIEGDGTIINQGNIYANCKDLCLLSVDVNSDSLFEIAPSSQLMIKDSNLQFSNQVLIGYNGSLIINGDSMQKCTKSSSLVLENGSRLDLTKEKSSSSFCNISMGVNSVISVSGGKLHLAQILADSSAIVESFTEISNSGISFRGTLKSHGILDIGNLMFQVGKVHLVSKSVVNLGLVTITTNELTVEDSVTFNLKLGHADDLPFTVIFAQKFVGKPENIKISYPDWNGCEISQKFDGMRLVIECVPAVPQKPSANAKVILILIIVGISFGVGILAFVLFRRQMKKARDAKHDGDARESLIGMERISKRNK